MTGVASKCIKRGVADIVLLFLLVLIGSPQTAISRSAAADFDARAGQIGRSEAWFELYGPEDTPVPGTSDLPQLLVPLWQSPTR